MYKKTYVISFLNLLTSPRNILNNQERSNQQNIKNWSIKMHLTGFEPV
jgi:hypothetical protein